MGRMMGDMSGHVVVFLVNMAVKRCDVFIGHE